MAGQRSAGYCSSCNRGVSIVRPQRNGIMEKMKSVLQQTDDDSDWVCTKCGKPASRGFAPQPTERPFEETTDRLPPGGEMDALKTTEPEHMAPKPEPLPPDGTDNRLCPSCLKPNPVMAAKCSACNEDMNLPSSLEATCHHCSKPVTFTAESVGTQTTCPNCSAAVVLPELTEDASALTKAPFIIKIDDDPERPEISKAVCTQCNFELTYPKRLAGKHVDCPSCSVKFILP